MFFPNMSYSHCYKKNRWTSRVTFHTEKYENFRSEVRLGLLLSGGKHAYPLTHTSPLNQRLPPQATVKPALCPRIINARMRGTLLYQRSHHR